MKNVRKLNWQQAVGALLLMSALISCTATQYKEVAEKPNVLFIAVDDLRCGLGCYGDNFAITPNIDALGASGMVFNRAYCQQAVCNPSRASLMTGLRPNTTKVWDLSTHFRKALPDVTTLPQHFKNHGYHTQSVGKIYHDPAWAQDSLSWSAPETMAVTTNPGKYVLPHNRKTTGSWKAAASEQAPVEDDAYIDGQVSRAAVDILKEIKDKPFFLAVGFRRPHLPFSAPEKYWNLYDRASVPMPENANPPDGAPSIALHPSVELRGYTDIPDEGPISDDKIRELRHGYYAATSYTDAQIGKVLNTLDSLGLRENTIIVLWSDHGFHLGEHGLWAKTTNFELDTRVPLIISYPGQKHKGKTTDAIVELVDLYPTLADLAHLPVPESLEGTSVKPVLEDPSARWEEAAFSQFPRKSKDGHLMGYSVRTNDLRYTEWVNVQSGDVEAEELYDYRNGLLETTNVIDDEQYKTEIDTLRRLLDQIR